MAEDVPDKIRALPPDWWKEPTTPRVLSNYFSRHVIALHLVVEVDGKPQQTIYTGFVVFHVNRIVWATAGHVIDQILAIRNHTGTRVIKADWIDTMPFNIPVVDFANLPLLTGTPLGYDVGAASLRNAELMLSGNPDLEFFTELSWRDLDKAKPEGFYLVGFPEIWFEGHIDRLPQMVRAALSAQLACAPVERVFDRTGTSSDAFWNHTDSFYGRVMDAQSNEGTPLSNIVGTSGGAIISIERTPEGRLLYRLFGIQSEWDRESRIIRAEPIEALAALLETMAKQHEDVPDD